MTDLAKQADDATRRATQALERLQKQHEQCDCTNGCACERRTKTARKALQAAASTVRKEAQ